MQLPKTEASLRLLESKFVNIFQEQSTIFVSDNIADLFKEACAGFFDDEDLKSDFESQLEQEEFTDFVAAVQELTLHMYLSEPRI